MKKYLDLAHKLGMTDAVIVSPDKIAFDRRALLKCAWGCEDYANRTVRCGVRETSFEERLVMVNSYRNILALHSHNAHELSKAALAIERAAFLDGHYFAFAIRYCNYCPQCNVAKGGSCAFPDKVRPCDQAFGIDVYQTARRLGLPINVLQGKNEVQNRYGFVLID